MAEVQKTQDEALNPENGDASETTDGTGDKRSIQLHKCGSCIKVEFNETCCFITKCTDNFIIIG